MHVAKSKFVILLTHWVIFKIFPDAYIFEITGIFIKFLILKWSCLYFSAWKFKNHSIILFHSVTLLIYANNILVSAKGKALYFCLQATCLGYLQVLDLSQSFPTQRVATKFICNSSVCSGRNLIPFFILKVWIEHGLIFQRIQHTSKINLEVVYWLSLNFAAFLWVVTCLASVTILLLEQSSSSR